MVSILGYSYRGLQGSHHLKAPHIMSRLSCLMFYRQKILWTLAATLAVCSPLHEWESQLLLQTQNYCKLQLSHVKPIICVTSHHTKRRGCGSLNPHRTSPLGIRVGYSMRNNSLQKLTRTVDSQAAEPGNTSGTMVNTVRSTVLTTRTTKRMLWYLPDFTHIIQWRSIRTSTRHHHGMV